MRAPCLGIHLTMPIVAPDPATMSDLTPAEKSALAGMKHYRAEGSGYARQQGTRPQTLGYGLADSPAGQAAWVVEKYQAWMDCDGHPENVLTRDELLDQVMLYWLPNSATSSARLYWESFAKVNRDPVDLPTGISLFPKEIFRCSRRWAEARFKHIVHWREFDRGGHFAALERPEVLVDEIRTCFRLRPARVPEGHAMHMNIGQLLTRRAFLSPQRRGDGRAGRGAAGASISASSTRAATAWRMRLRASGVQPGDRVALLLMNGAEFIESFFAVAKIGAVNVPLNWRLVADELEFILKDCGATVLLYAQNFAPVVAELQRRGDGTDLRTWVQVGGTARGLRAGLRGLDGRDAGRRAGAWPAPTTTCCSSCTPRAPPGCPRA